MQLPFKFELGSVWLSDQSMTLNQKDHVTQFWRLDAKIGRRILDSQSCGIQDTPLLLPSVVVLIKLLNQPTKQAMGLYIDSLLAQSTKHCFQFKRIDPLFLRLRSLIQCWRNLAYLNQNLCMGAMPLFQKEEKGFRGRRTRII